MVRPLEVKFLPNKFLALTIETPEVPVAVRSFAREHDLEEKTPVHVSVMVTRNAQVLWNAIASTSTPAETEAKIETFFRSHAWEYELTNEYFFHEREYSAEDMKEDGYPDVPHCTIRSIVQKVHLPDLAHFYQEVNDILGTDMKAPIPHVTLFTWTDGPLKGRGVGINSPEEFAQATKQKITV